MAGGTDAKQFSRLGITGYGFSPLKLPPGFDYQALFHGVDERVPVEALHFGVRVLDRFLRDGRAEPMTAGARRYGTWASPIDAADRRRARRPARLRSAAVGDEVWWTEPRPAEGGRRTS